jgi:hypothetical protein
MRGNPASARQQHILGEYNAASGGRYEVRCATVALDVADYALNIRIDIVHQESRFLAVLD